MDERLLERARAGDPEAFGQLVSGCEHAVWRLCWSMLRSTEDARDAVQETMLRAWRSLGTYRGACSLETWLKRIASNHCLDVIRARKNRAAESVEALQESGFEPAAPEEGPAERLERAERGRALRRALERLPEKQRVPLMLSAADHRPYDEIAEVLELPVGTVKSRINRGRAALRILLDEELGDTSGNNPAGQTSGKAKGGRKP